MYFCVEPGIYVSNRAFLCRTSVVFLYKLQIKGNICKKLCSETCSDCTITNILPAIWYTHWMLFTIKQANVLTHWGRATHICVGKLSIIGSDNGLSPGRRQAIIRTNAGILLIRPLGTNFSEFLVKILIVSFKKMHLKVSSAKRRPFCICLNELTLEMQVLL